jgi:hypothetical protein
MNPKADAIIIQLDFLRIAAAAVVCLDCHGSIRPLCHHNGGNSGHAFFAPRRVKIFQNALQIGENRCPKPRTQSTPTPAFQRDLSCSLGKMGST